LSGDDIAEANAWAARRPKNAPEPTALHLDFIRASEQESEARSSAQRKQLEAMAAAQAERETALRQAEEAQRKRAAMARIRNIALVAVSILALLAGWLYGNAEQQRKVAEEQRAVAQEQRKAAQEQREQADRILTAATSIIVNLPDQMNDNTKKKIFAVFRTGADHGDATSMANLGTLYSTGVGGKQDYAKAREWFEKAADKGEVEEEETKREGKPGEEMACALNSVAWYALFARAFTNALTVADRAHALLPDDLGIETNRAHALMFLERGEECKSLYLAYKGKPMSGQSAKLWEQAIAEDFAEFRKAGLTHPNSVDDLMMAEIEKELGVSP
jgi:hypothetical protein